MLPDRLIELKTADDTTHVPSWLSSRDEVWLRPFCDEIEVFAGRKFANARFIDEEEAVEHTVLAHEIFWRRHQYLLFSRRS